MWVTTTVSNDEDSVPAGNELSNSCHACQHMGVKSEKQFLRVETPTETVALAQDFFKTQLDFFNAFVPVFPNQCRILNSSWLLTYGRAFPHRLKVPASRSWGFLMWDFKDRSLSSLEQKAALLFPHSFGIFPIYLGVQCETKNEEMVDLQAGARTQSFVYCLALPEWRAMHSSKDLFRLAVWLPHLMY